MKLTFKTPEIIARAVKAGLTVYWQNGSYKVTEDGRGVTYISPRDSYPTVLRWPSYDVKDFFSYVSQDTEDFLATLLFCNEPDGRPEDGAQQNRCYDFAPEFVAAVEQFISRFRETLDDLDLDVLSRSFGGNVYLSLSGHGAGFWDDSHPMGQVAHAGKPVTSVPVVENIHKKVYEAASRPCALEMSTWHSGCGTAHCRAGWVVTLAGEEGAALEAATSTEFAAMAIYAASSDVKVSPTEFYLPNEEALEHMKELALL